MKNTIKKIVNKLGYKIERLEQLEVLIILIVNTAN